MKTQTIRLSESKLKEMIKNAINEFRDDNFRHPDGDRRLVRPNGETNIMTNLNSISYGEKLGKRAKTNATSSLDGSRYTTFDNAGNKFMHGKGQLCHKAYNAIDDILQVNGKVVWTDKEKKAISDIKNAIGELAQLTKDEGNEKRGYNGPKKDEKPE